MDVAVRINVPEGVCSARSLNISAGGIAVGTGDLQTLAPEGRCAYDLLPHGRIVTLTLTLPTGAAFTCTARVRWVVGDERFGGEFVEVSDECRAALSEFVGDHQSG